MASSEANPINFISAKLAELIALGDVLLLDESWVVKDLSSAVTVDQIMLQFEILRDDVQDPSHFPDIRQRANQWSQLLKDIEDVKDIFQLVDSDAELPATKSVNLMIGLCMACRSHGEFALTIHFSKWTPDIPWTEPWREKLFSALRLRSISISDLRDELARPTAADDDHEDVVRARQSDGGEGAGGDEGDTAGVQKTRPVVSVKQVGIDVR